MHSVSLRALPDGEGHGALGFLGLPPSRLLTPVPPIQKFSDAQTVPEAGPGCSSETLQEAHRFQSPGSGL